ncbi:MAG TPA: hypothetical protein VLX68_03030 [Chitinivibrionales bacterium]|nr:hypothetical protein [Chitinivibrionales bacterium]
MPEIKPANLPREMRPWAIWIWNFNITREEIASQIAFFIEKGFGGVAIKASRDMTPSFLSEEFFSLFLFALQTAQRAKIGIRLAEDFSLPWNGAFDNIAGKNRHLRAQCLVLEHSEVIHSKTVFERIIADPQNAIVQIGKIENDRVIVSKTKTIPVTQDKNTVSWKAPAGSWQVMIFRKKYVADPVCAYIPNAFREQTARSYIETVWESFKKRFSKFMPLTFEGFITEVPAYLPADNSIPWDDDLVVKYRSKYKKNLVPLLPSLFFNSEAAHIKNRPHVYSFLAQSLHERFTLILDKWCKKYRLSHWVLCAERPVQKAANMLRDCTAIPVQGFASVGIQNQEGCEENAGIVRAMADANAKEFRRETITVIGRNRQGNAATLQSLKSEIDQNVLSGPSRIVLDGCFFSVDHRSYVKTPYNPSWYSPGADNMLLLCDYAARVKKLIGPLQLSRQAAILMPSNSILADYLPGNDEAVRKGMLSLHKTMDELSHLTLDFDIISEEQLLSCSLFSNGEFNTPSKARKGNYQALLIPYARLVSKNLFVFLERMASKKSTIVFIDEAPQGTIDEGVTPPFTSRVNKIVHSKSGRVYVSPAANLESILAHVKSMVAVTVQGKKCPDIVASSGSAGSQTVYCLQNRSDSLDYFAAVEVPEEKYFYFSDCASGETHEIIDVQRKDDTCRINLNFSPRQTYFIIATSQKQAVTSMPKGRKPPINVIGTVQRNYRIVLKDQWQFSPCSLNVLPLAAWNTRIGLSREFGGYSHFYETYFEVKELPSMAVFSLCGVGGACAVLAKGEKSVEVNINGTRITETGSLAPAALLALFPPPAPAQSLTGVIQEPLPAEHGHKPCLDLYCKNVLCFNIKDSLRKGLNRISVRTLGLVFDPMTITYPPLIAGTFNILKGSNGWVIDTTEPMVGHDSWTKYGYPYMSGCGTYKQVFEIPSDYNRLVLKFSQVSGPVSVGLNTTKLGTYTWHPIEMDITDVCESKRNELSVSVMNTIDNVIRMNGRPSGLIGEAYLDVY